MIAMVLGWGGLFVAMAGVREEAWAACDPFCDSKDITEHIYESMTLCNCGGCVWGDLMKTIFTDTKTRLCDLWDCKERGERACTIMMPEGDPPDGKCWFVEGICSILLCIEDKQDDPDCPGCDLQKVYVCNAIGWFPLYVIDCPTE